MTSDVKTVDQYIAQLPDDRVEAMTQLRKTILKNLPKGFEEAMSYGMVGYVVPHKVYPDGYHCDPKLPLPFLAFASQKNFVAVYHMGMYADPHLLEWFTESYAKRVPGKLDMGKSCVRFKKPDQIPFELIGELVAKMTVKDWVSMYEKNYKPKKK
ncbi:MAG: DUF1801 domain-containing protein [Flavobacteriales bacterium]